MQEASVTAVATGKSREGLRRVFERTGLEGFFMTTQTASECLPKPNAEMLEKIGIELDVPAERTVSRSAIRPTT